MHLNSRLLFVMLASVLVALAAASCTSSSPANPEYKFSEGGVTKYTFQTSQVGKVTIDGETEDFDLHMTNTVAQTVQRVDESGLATVDTTYESSVLTVDGEDLPLPDLTNAQVTFDISGDGAIQNVRGTHGLAGPLGERQLDPAQILQFQGPIFRDGDLKKGDKWQQNVVIPMPGTDPIKATIEYVYEGMEKVNGKRVAKIAFVFDAPLDLMLTDIDQFVKIVGREQIAGTSLFSLEQGRTIAASGSGPLQLSMMMPGEGGGEDLERLKVEIEVGFDYALQD